MKKYTYKTIPEDWSRADINKAIRNGELQSVDITQRAEIIELLKEISEKLDRQQTVIDLPDTKRELNRVKQLNRDMEDMARQSLIKGDI